MDYGNLLTRAGTIVWDHKFLMVLGVLVALGSGNTATSGTNYQTSGQESESMTGLIPGSGQFEPWMGVAAISVIALIAFFFVIALVVWVVAQVARGGLIAGVDTVEEGQDATFGKSWRVGWGRALPLVGIGLAPLIPALVLIGTAISIGGMFFGLSTIVGDGALVRTAGGGVAAILVAVACIAALIMLALALLSTFAYRACILEETGVLASYRRGWQVLGENLGPALIIFLLQVAINIVLAVVLFIPGIIACLCCLLWPVLLLIQGAITAYFSTVWTLAWREWTGRQPATALDVV